MKSISQSIVVFFISIVFVGGCDLLRPIASETAEEPDESVAPTNPDEEETPEEIPAVFSLSFESAIVLDSAGGPIAADVADIDDTEGLDILSLNQSADSVSLFLSESDSEFSVADNTSTEDAPVDWAIADLDGDGSLDIVTVNQDADSFVVFLNDGAGSFTDTSFPTGVEPVAILAQDFSGDDNPDIAIIEQGADRVSVFINDGSGGFVAATGSPYTVGDVPVAMAIGDFNDDTFDDIAVANSGDGNITVLFGDGDGTFDGIASADHSVGDSPSAIAVIDLDAENGVDIAVTNKDDDSVSVLLNDGTGDFEAAEDYTVGSEPSHIVAADLNADGSPDLVVLNSQGDSFSVLINDEAGDNIGAFLDAVDYATGEDPNDLVVADISGDGKADVIVSNFTSDNVSVYENDASGVFDLTENFSVGDGPKGLAIEDVNDDSKLDIVVANSNDDSVSILLQSSGT